MTIFHLYRLKDERPETPSNFDDQRRGPGAIILCAIEEKPSQEIRKGQVWRIGNVPKEWFLVPLFAIDEAVEKIKERTIGKYFYDVKNASLKERATTEGAEL